MKKAFQAGLLLAVIAFSAYSLLVTIRTRGISDTLEIKVLLVYTPSLAKDEEITLRAYRSVLEEEGFPYQEVGAPALLSMDPESILRSKPVIIFPDGAAKHVPEEMRFWIERYLQAGGSAAFIYDAGTQDVKGRFLNEGVFAEVTGVNNVTFEQFRDQAYTLGHLKLLDQKSLEFFQVPEGKTQAGLLLGGYAYGTLEYPMARTRYLRRLKPEDIFATAETLAGEAYPGIVLSDRGPGKVLYVNLPLGYVKCYSDDFPLRSVLRTFLAGVVKMPHLVGVRDGRGGLVINWHIDSSIDWRSLRDMMKDGYLGPDLRYSLDITAGDFRDTPGDGLGFDACGKGRPTIDLIKGFGSVGSHGGWAHNWFAAKVESGAFVKREIYANIKRNTDCLESVTGTKVVEYSAPNGIHPQPVTTEVLEELGFLAYYYTGDTGSAPNRTFLNGRKISDKVIAFPIMPLGKSASLYEMKGRGTPEDEVERWLLETTDYVIRNRTVRLVYSHPYDVPDYPRALKTFLKYASRKQKEGLLRVESMGEFASFLLRFLKTRTSFTLTGETLTISLRNPEGLEGITVALPRGSYARPSGPGLIVQEAGDYYDLILEGSGQERTIVVNIL
jgi:hypothetical protein